ncbi:MAG: hypothetical protein AABY22_24475 [Nanoarchaeota archaeon]
MNTEKLKKLIIPILIKQILMEKGRGVVLDFNSVADMDNNILYIIEDNLTKQKVMEGITENNSYKDIFFIDIREIPNDLEEAYKYLSDKVV